MARRHTRRAHTFRPLSIGEIAVLGLIADDPHHIAGGFVSLPAGRGKAAYALVRDGHLRRLCGGDSKGRGTATRSTYRINPLSVAVRFEPDGGGWPAPVCHANDCTIKVSVATLMCARHWARVPDDLRGKIETATPEGHVWSGALAMHGAPLTLIHLADQAILFVARLEARRGPVL